MEYETIFHSADLCVVGGGMAGLCAAVAAARHGAKVVLMQERPMLGGNASSEIRMWICGAHGANNRETGILEEIMLENLYRNPALNFHIWDGILLEWARREENLTLLLNCTCTSCEMSGNRIASVTGWQMTTQTWRKVEAKLFADCSGDSVLAPLSGAKFRVGREARSEFDEDIEPEQADRHTMGLSLLIQAREQSRPCGFTPPGWAYHFTAEQLHHRLPNMEDPMENFWYLELGGMGDSIADTEKIRDELLKTAYGVWDYVKNAPENKEKNKYWQLDFLGILPGKRESRRYEGDLMLNQRQVQAGGVFPDVVAYGGWPMDDHDPMGFHGQAHPNVNHPTPAPYGIPYRCLYSRNVENLLFAGRNISATHAAMSSTRVMGTCAILGQAVGAAAALALQVETSPRGVYETQMDQLQQTLLWDDCFLPGIPRKVSPLALRARLDPAYEPLRRGRDRDRAGEEAGVSLEKGARVEYHLEKPAFVREARVIFDSFLDRELLNRLPLRNMLCNRARNLPEARLPESLVRAYRLEAITAAGERLLLAEDDQSHCRRLCVPVNAEISALRLTCLDTWGAEKCRVFSFDFR
ncbi:MAG: FAD-dependent oxidoreductase [Eubacteriales bacterium]|nr:FAD-dependent oxidoreductase [Clostridiales bacterium]MDD6932514.1 FAD-dependent oxidoreductase [Eubacteriales bacterium]MDY2600364.1 FAD-dependent oxidoreductase [Eubacteriales bacterium]